MKTLNLRDASVVGFFSLPSPSLAEYNPSAYNAAMADAPEGAGTCAYCGTGIRNHVVVEVDGRRAFIGIDCASRIGGSLARCAGERLTAAQMAERDAKRDARQAEYNREAAEHRARVAARLELFTDVLAALDAQGTEFHRSLASQLRESGDLSPRQAECACKALFGPRQNKGNRAAWDALHDQLTGAEAYVEAA